MKDEEEEINENDEIQDNESADQEEIQQVAAKHFEGEHFYENNEDPEETLRIYSVMNNKNKLIKQLLSSDMSNNIHDHKVFNIKNLKVELNLIEAN